MPVETPEPLRCRGILEIVFQRHRHRHFAGTLLHYLEIPPLQPRPAVLGIRERGEDAAIHHQPVVIEDVAPDPVGHAYFRAIKLFVAGRLVNDGKNAPAKFGHERYLQITILEHVGAEGAIDDGLLVERPADESVLRIGRVLDGAPRNRRLAERHSVGHRRRRMHDGMKRTDRRKCCSREADTDTRGSRNCHLGRLRTSGPILSQISKTVVDMAGSEHGASARLPRVLPSCARRAKGIRRGEAYL